ncbi:SDR family oxidoreductase [Salegentibacter sp. LM13S]|uniref:SDR family oxidoreductase n=1 Tax=Salegentibacter lacus TaxID=2873599 RepID=UPI001CCBCEE3|nr:SDR family oxidoreductase [Salegentibacter lacus]MBZ9630705.1 SDR family oxidoreductase [Salegentibacter lacus]
MWNLNDKCALVTGGTKGIGKAAVLEFLELGAEVLFTSRTQKDIDLVLEELEKYGNKIHGLVADVTIADDRQKVFNFIEKEWGKLDILVNNAGINIRKKANDYSEEEFRKVMEINLNAPFELSRKLHSLLQKSGNAKIVNVASSAAMQDVGTGTPYAMSKAGLLQQTRSFAVEWAADGIRVNAVSPWFTVTPLTKGLLNESERMDNIIKRTPLNRVAKASEMAAIIAFLAMDKSSYITGQNIIADGGMSINAI